MDCLKRAASAAYEQSWFVLAATEAKRPQFISMLLRLAAFCLSLFILCRAGPPPVLAARAEAEYVGVRC